MAKDTRQRRTRPGSGRAGWLTTLLALTMLVGSPGALPALGNDGGGGRSAEAFRLSLERNDPGDRQLLMLARKLIQGGRCDQALVALDRYFSSKERDRGLELEAEALGPLKRLDEMAPRRARR